jgi:histidyl-tRNA synthetase
MVRGLDYYTRTTFELVTGLLGSQSAVAAGGRYDGLVADLGGPALPGIGFALGVERVALLMGNDTPPAGPVLFIAALGEAARRQSFSLMSALQRHGVSVEMDYEGKSLKSQMRRADKLKARQVLIVGESEVTAGTAQLKNMQEGTQQEVALDAAALLPLVANL